LFKCCILCKIIKKESGRDHITAIIDFEQTESKLCSIVIFNGRDFTSYFLNGKNLCFEAYAEDGIHCVDIEILLRDVDMQYEMKTKKLFRFLYHNFAMC